MKTNVLVSMIAPKGSKVYHKENCIYARRILAQNCMSISLQKALKHHYRACKYCSGLSGEILVKKSNLARWEKQYNMTIKYLRNCDTLYLRTSNGFWKIFQNRDDERFVLYHLNNYSNQLSFSEATSGEFHRQRDVKASTEIDGMIKYAFNHDKAKSIIEDDYRKLPRTTKKQRKYYKQAKNKARRESYRRVDELFAMLEAHAI